MTRKKKRAVWIGGGLALLAAIVGVTLLALEDTIVFFYSPTKVLADGIPPGKRIRMGGIVVDGSVKRGAGTAVSFAVTDLEQTITVAYDGILPDLFREGQTVVTEGQMGGDGKFMADTVLAKHDENYMPPEVADALKAKGVWKDGGKTAQENYQARHNQLTKEMADDKTDPVAAGGQVESGGYQ